MTFRRVLLGLSLLVSQSAHAHFVLVAPDNWMSQDSVGIPEKGPPCGDEGGGTATNKVTAYSVGDTVTITIDEKVFHPGHYRVALAIGGHNNLPPEPAVTTDSNSPCGSAAIESPAVYPVLADNLFPHTTMFTAPQTATIKLPAGVTCDNCTLQILEFMGDHSLNVPGGCFYHHCADIKITDPNATDAGESMMSVDSGSSTTSTDASAAVATPDMTPAAAAKPKSGCSMGQHAPNGIGIVVLLMVAGLVLRRRRLG